MTSSWSVCSCRSAVVAIVLELRGLTQIERGRTVSYQPGQIVTFRKGAKGMPRPGISYRVEAVDLGAGTVRLAPDRGRTIDSQPARWGAD
jgi:hypothetical protein